MAATSSTSRCRLPGGWASSSAHELVEVVPTAGRRRCPGMLSPQMSPSRCAGTAPLHRRWPCSLRPAAARTCFPRPVAARTRIYTLRPHPRPVPCPPTPSACSRAARVGAGLCPTGGEVSYPPPSGGWKWYPRNCAAPPLLPGTVL